MEGATGVAVVAAFVVVYAAVSARLARTWVTGPIVFVAAGLALGPDALDLVPLSLDSELVRVLAEVTLVLVLFTDAARIPLRGLRREGSLPARMLVVGMPLAIVLGALAAWSLFDVNLWTAALVAAVLAPTDAAVGQVVVTSRSIPVRIRQTVNVESGLNDGIAAPFVTLFLAGASASEGLESAGYWVSFAAKQIGYGALLGLGIGLVGGWIVEIATRRGWMDGTFRQLAVLALAVAAFFAAEHVDGNGFIAAFVAGLAVGNVTRDLGEAIFDFTEDEGQLLTLLTFLVFGGAFVGAALDQLTWRIACYVVLSLTVVRMVPILLSLLGAGLRPMTVGLLGWFGPRGLASIVFGLTVLDAADVPQRDDVFLLVTWTVLVSIVVHGLSATPLARWYGRRVEAMAEPEAAEMESVEEIAVRFVPHHLRGDRRE